MLVLMSFLELDLRLVFTSAQLISISNIRRRNRWLLSYAFCQEILETGRYFSLLFSSIYNPTSFPNGFLMGFRREFPNALTLLLYSALHFAFPRALTRVLPQHSLWVANMRFRVCSAIANPVRPTSFLVRSHMYLLVRFPMRQFFFLSDLCVFEDLLYTKPVPQ